MAEIPDLQAQLDRANKTIEILVAQRNEAHDRNVSLLVQANTALEAKDRKIAELEKAAQPQSNVINLPSADTEAA